VGRLNNKVAIVTGAARGTGRVAAILFAKEGAKVIVADIDADGGEETVNAIKEADGNAIFIKADVSQEEDVKSMIRKAVDIYGKLDVLYNNAGITGKATSIMESTEEEWQKVLAVDLKSVWLGMKYAIPEMLKVGKGSIINTASIAAVRGLPNLPAYAAAKGGVLSLSRATAIEYASKDIRVNCINPSPIASPMVQSFSDDAQMTFLAAIPRHKLATMEEIAQVALFLASDEASHVTGQAWGIDGGMEANSGMVA